MANELFLECLREQGDLAGVLEADEAASYLYLYDTTKPEGQKIIGSMPIDLSTEEKALGRVELKWSDSGSWIGIFVGNELRAAINASTRQCIGTGDSAEPSKIAALEREFSRKGH